MARNPVHAMRPVANANEAARQRFVLALKGHIGRKIRPGNRKIFDALAKPRFAEQNGHEPTTEGEMAEAMYAEPGYQTFCELLRSAQEMLWQAVGETIWRERERITSEFDRLSADDSLGGSLEIDPDFVVPAAIRNVNIHLQPGGYAMEDADDDVLAGALYELGGALYSMAGGIGTRQSKGEIVHRYLTDRWPDFKPARILDMACSAGSSSTPYALAWPDAEVHAIDVGAGLLRYAHARARALGAPVHFHQRDVGDTGFESGSFDLVISHNGMHEMSTRTQKAMMKETWRLLRPGGVCVHQDVPLRYSECDTFTRFDYGWDLKNNNEPFWVAYATNDCEQMLADAGFPNDAVTVGYLDQADKSMRWYAAVARKPEAVSAAA